MHTGHFEGFCYTFRTIKYSGVEERYLGRLKRALKAEMLFGTLIKFGETFVSSRMAIPSQAGRLDRVRKV